MSASEPHTRRQLREALGQAERAASEQHEQTRYVESLLHILGAKPQGITTLGYGYGQRVERRTWDVSAVTAKAGVSIGGSRVSGQGKVNEAVDALLGKSVDETRASTLRTVLEALQISGYTRRDSLREEIRRLSAAHNNGEAVSVRDRDTGPSFDTDRFWADLQTALDVRAERKTTEERAATEKKVAGLTAPKFATGGFTGVRHEPSGIVHPAGHIHAVALSEEDRELIRTIQEATKPAVSAEDISAVATIGKELGVEGDLQSFAETAAKLADEPAPKKKSAKKKQETAK